MNAFQLCQRASASLFAPVPGGLSALRDGGGRSQAEAAEREIDRFVSQKFFPCVGAVHSLRHRDYLLGIYSGFGTGASWRELRQDLLYFLAEARRSQSPYLTFWAIFPGEATGSEECYERSFWNELSHLTSLEDREEDWGSDPVKDPTDPAFQIRLAGEALFAVGLHPVSERRGRRFSSCAIVFNAFSQFEALDKAGKYQPMIKANRRLDTLFQGTPNPMVVEHGEKWETIQFSGSAKPKTWKCPFAFLHRSKKN